MRSLTLVALFVFFTIGIALTRSDQTARSGQSEAISIAAGCVAPPANMVSWWAGDGNANDIQGSNHGTVSGGVGYAGGKVGQAFDLNGTNGIITIGNPSNLQLTTAITAEAWIRPDTTFADYRTVVSKWSQTSQQSWGLFVNSNRIYAIVANGNGQFTDAIGGNIPFGTTASMTHVAMTYSAADGIRVYVNGALVDSDVSVGNMKNGSDVVRIGNDSGLVGVRYFDGLIDEASVYNRALSAAEIQAIAGAGVDGKCKPGAPTPTPTPTPIPTPTPGNCLTPPSGMVAWYPGDGTANDIQGTNHGTSTLR